MNIDCASLRLGVYPFLIGEFDDVERLSEASEFNTQDVASIIRASLDIDTAEWIEARRADAEEYEFSADEVLGEWPGEVPVKRDIVEQGCGSVSYLAATLINSPYWYFWWD